MKVSQQWAENSVPQILDGNKFHEKSLGANDRVIANAVAVTLNYFIDELKLSAFIDDALTVELWTTDQDFDCGTVLKSKFQPVTLAESIASDIAFNHGRRTDANSSAIDADFDKAVRFCERVIKQLRKSQQHSLDQRQ